MPQAVLVELDLRHITVRVAAQSQVVWCLGDERVQVIVMAVLLPVQAGVRVDSVEPVCSTNRAVL